METRLKLTDANGIGLGIGMEVQPIQGKDQYFYNPSIADLDEMEDMVLLKEYDDEDGEWFDCEDVVAILDIRDISEHEGLDYVETTTGSNGYPENLKFAIVGFKTFEQAQEIADKYGLDIESFKRKDGWQLWSRNGSRMFSAFENSAEYFGDNYSEETEESVTGNIISRLEDEFENIESKIDFLEDQIKILKAIEEAEEDEIVITEYGEYYDTIKQESMSFSHDTWNYVIGLIQN